MISPKIIKALLSTAAKERKDAVITEIFNHISNKYTYDSDIRANHILEMLVDDKAVVTDKDINVDYINNNLNLVMYSFEKYNIKDIKVETVDNIEGEVLVSYKYLEKINEDRGDIGYVNSSTTISYLNYPNILK